MRINKKKRINFSELTKRPIFEYEVIGQVGDLTFEEWEENGCIQQYPMCKYLIKSLGGSEWCSNTIFCSLYGDDALKHLRPGEIISAKLRFNVKKNDNSSYEQQVVAGNLITLNDFYKNRKVLTAYEGEIQAKAEATA